MSWSFDKRSLAVYATLIALGGGVCGWQAIEHGRVKQAAATTLINRGRDVTSTLGLVVRSQRRFGVLVPKERLESALKELLRPGELVSIAVQSASGETIASAGQPIDLGRESSKGGGLYWGDNTLTLVNLMDIGGTPNDESHQPSEVIVLSEEQLSHAFRSPGRRPRLTPGQAAPQQQEGKGTPAPTGQPTEGKEPTQPAPSRPQPGNGLPPPLPPGLEPPPLPPLSGEGPKPGVSGTIVVRSETRRVPIGRPYWMSQDEYDAIIHNKSASSILITLSTDELRATIEKDLLLRLLVSALAIAAASVSILAWYNLTRTANLQIRLVKAAEMNAHLKEMNLAAAGLAHETRNPLNLIRGLAQMISMEAKEASKLRQHAATIMEEADRVTVQLNEFIDYSKPREAHFCPVDFAQLAADVARTLVPDLEEKQIELRLTESKLKIIADEQLLRQALFNLLLNATQAVEPKGFVEVALLAEENREATIEIRDSGPGVPEAQREAIFKPYVTMRPKGVGLGLAIVQQIVSAHGWVIRCQENKPRGALFRIEHVKCANS